MIKRLFEYYTYGSALCAGGAVITNAYDHPFAAAISTAAAVIGGIHAFREAARQSAARIEAKLTEDIEYVQDTIDHTARGTFAGLWDLQCAVRAKADEPATSQLPTGTTQINQAPKPA